METLQTVNTESIGPGVDAAASRLNLETLVEQKKSRRLTWDALTHCGRSGELESKTERLVILPLSAGCRGSTTVDAEDADVPGPRSHPETLPNNSIGSIGPGVNAAVSKSDL